MNSLNKVLALVALLFLSIAPVSPASAHTETDRTTPSAGQTLDAGVQKISVVFTDRILNLADSSEIAITDGSGNQVETACVEVDDKSMTADAFLPTEGEYKVVWRTVAEDGHPISGKFSFNVQGNSEKIDFVSCKDLASQGNVVIATPKAEPSTTQDEVSTVSEIIWPYWVGGFAILITWLVLAVRRRKTKG